MNKWTHSLCYECYENKEPGRVPHVLINPDLESCCQCLKRHRDGIYYRADPALLACHGQLGIHLDEETE